MSIHSRNDDIILQFGLKKPAYRIVVNSPTTHGSIGLTTGLDPAMTLGCGGYGGNITSDNISPRHLLNIKRLAYEITPAVVRQEARRRQRHGGRSCRRRPPSRRPAGLAAESLARRIDQFLASRGYTPPPGDPSCPGHAGHGGGSAASRRLRTSAVATAAPHRKTRRVRVRRRREAGDEAGPENHHRGATIVTPAARDLGEQHRCSSRRPGRAEVRSAEPRVRIPTANTLEQLGVTVDPGGSAVLCCLPQLYSGFPLSADSKARQLDSTVEVVMAKTGAPRPGGDLNRVSERSFIAAVALAGAPRCSFVLRLPTPLVGLLWRLPSDDRRGVRLQPENSEKLRPPRRRARRASGAGAGSRAGPRIPVTTLIADVAGALRRRRARAEARPSRSRAGRVRPRR